MIKKIFTFTAGLLFLVGCGPESTPESKKDATMIIGKQYKMYAGNKIIKNVEGTHIQITHVNGESESTAILIDGNASIIRKPKS